jgi:hypothetical protein
MPGSSRLPVSLRDTFNAARQSSAKGQLVALNLEVYAPLQPYTASSFMELMEHAGYATSSSSSSFYDGRASSSIN